MQLIKLNIKVDFYQKLNFDNVKKKSDDINEFFKNDLCVNEIKDILKQIRILCKNLIYINI